MPLRKFSIPFHKGLFLSISGLFSIFVGITLALQYFQEKNIRQDNLYTLLQEYNEYVAHTLPDNLIIDHKEHVALFDNYPYRLTIIDAGSGNVLLDNSISGTIDDNHLNRPEIRAALNGDKKAYATRYSDTKKEIYFYVAHRHNDFIIRSSMPYNQTISHILHVDFGFQYVLIGVALIFISAMFIYCYSLGKAISELNEIAQTAKRNKPLKELPDIINSPLRIITQNLRKSYEELRQAREALALEEEKLLAHIQTSREGIAIFKQNRQMIVSNNLFIQYINHITDNTINEDLEQVFVEPTLHEITQHVTQPYDFDGNDGNAIVKQIRINKNGMIFIVRGILFHDNSFEISIFDNTEREQEAMLKKELTQNISHELKTPVSSIRGYLETILNTPNLDAERMHLFLERSYSQTCRLSDLLNDISMLNRIDESSSLFDRTELNLSSIINDAINESTTALEKREMHISTSGLPPSMPIIGNYSLLYSIFRNLIDNAINYSGIGTSIVIHCYRNDEMYYSFSFSDNGVGVEEAYLHRLFDRFYRVDKGRSRKLGGTGLGLAIVKNAVIFHNGEIMAKKNLDGGLEILFSLKKS